MPLAVVPVRDFEDSRRALERVATAIDAVNPNALAPLNLSIENALSLIIGVAPGLARFRDDIATLPRFDISHVDRLSDYANATLYLHVTNLPEPKDSDGLEQRVAPLRKKLLLWAAPLANAGVFSQAALDKIRERTGIRDAACDLVALASLFRDHWEQVRSICGVTEDEIEQATTIGTTVYAAASRRENAPVERSEATLRVRKAWTLTDRAYSQCRRALAYLRFDEGDVDVILPSPRRNAGPRKNVIGS